MAMAKMANGIYLLRYLVMVSETVGMLLQYKANHL